MRSAAVILRRGRQVAVLAAVSVERVWNSRVMQKQHKPA